MIEQLVLLHFNLALVNHLTVHNSNSSQWKICFPGTYILLGPQKTEEERTVAPWLESVSWPLGIHFTHLLSDIPYSTSVKTHELDATRATVALRIFNGVLILEPSLKSGHWLMCYLNLLTGENVFIWLLKFRFSDKHLHKPVNIQVSQTITSSKRPRERKKALPAPRIKYLFRGQVCSGSQRWRSKAPGWQFSWLAQHFL